MCVNTSELDITLLAVTGGGTGSMAVSRAWKSGVHSAEAMGVDDGDCMAGRAHLREAKRVGGLPWMGRWLTVYGLAPAMHWVASGRGLWVGMVMRGLDIPGV